MTVRITVSEGPRGRSIRVEGRLRSDAVGELEQAVGDAPSSVSLELENLQSADSGGMAALRRLRGQGVALRGIPPHLLWRFEEEDSP